MALNEKYTKPYDPALYEKDIYTAWEKSGYFNPDNLPGERSEYFSIIMPPPNANGSLHAGHALFVTVQDILIRFHRMQGKKVLWQPGADHAGFETQVVYEKKLQKEGRSRFDMSREELYDEILAFTMENKSFMEGQIRDLGASCDWSRQTFTLDDKVVVQVEQTFAKLQSDGLLYRGLRSVNWCPKHQTAFSNLEIEHDERKDKFYYFQYGPFVIGTARPETKFGDKYVVMHPEDERYNEYTHGQEIEVEWINGPITATIIKDEAGDPEMGSGVMTITPWHSGIDFEIAQRHDLTYEQIINERGKLLPIAQEFEGMPIMEARAKIVEKLNAKGLLVKVDDNYDHSVPTCYKCTRELEPQLKQQWFITMKPLANKALDAINSDRVRFVTDQHRKIALHWLSSIEDWNISRQIAWGIPIPAKICVDCDHGMVDLDDSVTTCEKCSGSIIQDPDTFDTWFSSGQWPFTTLNYPEGAEYKNFYPTSVMETGADILMFWVLRMMMLGIYVTGDVPFKDVYLHGLVRDKKGQKMSKSKGNVTAPSEVADIYGTDALRMGLTVGNTPGTNMNLDPQKIGAYKKFANKLWNISRFIYANTEKFDFASHDAKKLSSHSQKILEAFDITREDIALDLQNYRIHLAAEKSYHYIWHTLADEIIESSKDALSEDADQKTKEDAQYLLLTLLGESLRILHPFMPFITEEIWKDFPADDKDLLMVTRW